ncbi:MAG: hypothetical protein HYV26_06285 [Candidatus Hydrogenedentes bacterium]|nr:hypothetical protein [Candidatus Hydrogenedentota bacterium]MBI3118123.1 hypothetical protein [Candidatus Hydrogenedentota bacterium]
MNMARYAQTAVLVLAALFVVFGTQVERLGDTANSRLATVFSLVHRGTWCIDTPPGEARNPFEPGTVDKVEVRGRIISSKPPLLPLLMTGEYVVLRAVFGWTLPEQPLNAVEEDARPTSSPEAWVLKQIVYVMTVSLVGFSYLLTLFFFARTLGLFIEAPWERVVALAAVAWATQLPGLATDLNNHIPGAGMLMVSLYLGLGLGSGKLAPSPWRFTCFGLTAALVFTIDMPLTIFAAFAGSYLLVKFPRQALVWSGLGAALPLAVHFAVMVAVTGSPLPVQTRDALYLYEGSWWRNPGGIDALNEPKGLYLLHMTFGRKGLFLLFPILLLGLFQGLRALVSRVPNRAYLLGGLAAFAVLTAYYVKSTNNYGGASYGFRWYVGAMPVLMLMGALWMVDARQMWKRGVVALLLVVSAFSAWESFRHPWGTGQEWTSRWIWSNGRNGPNGSNGHEGQDG